MEEILTYLQSAEFKAFFDEMGVTFLLGMMVIILLALWLEIRLPLGYYWSLPSHTLYSLLVALHLKKPRPVWGVCRVQQTNTPIALVACDLLDERSQKLLQRTYTNNKGEYGFKLQPGQYLIKAVKNHYRVPSLLDPENVVVYQVDESFAVSVAVVSHEVVPQIDLPLQSSTTDQGTARHKLIHYGRMFMLQLANVFIVLSVSWAVFGLWYSGELFYLLMAGVCVSLLLIKLYILETITVVTGESHA